MFSDDIRVVFLDIDGVLNCHSAYREFAEDKASENIISLSGFGIVDKSKVKILNEFLIRCKAAIVLSSTWRIGVSDSSIKELLTKVGISEEVPILGSTPVFNDKQSVRGNEIRSWIMHNIKDGSKYSNYLIIDDDSDMLLCQANNFLYIDTEVGLTTTGLYRMNFAKLHWYPS